MLQRLGSVLRLPRSSRCALHHLGGGRGVFTGRTTTFHGCQGGRLSIALPKEAAVVNVTTQWRDSCDVTISRLSATATDPGILGDSNEGQSESDRVGMESLGDIGLALQVDPALGHLAISCNEEWGREATAAKYLIEAVVPELFSVDLLVSKGSVSVGKKLKGDCRILLDEGDIEVGVVRGEDIRLSTGRGRVYIAELEGNINITATDVCAKLINGAKVKIDATGNGPSVRVGGLYSSEAFVKSGGNVAISSCHGRITVLAAGPAGGVTLSSVNGTAQVSTGAAGAQVHVDLLEEGTSSHIRSDGGDIAVSMTQEVIADMHIVGNISKLPPSFEGDIQAAKAVGTINGQNGGLIPSRGIGGGKIDLAGARDQSLRHFFPSDVASSVRPKLVITSIEGSVALETLSWAENVVRKFEIEHADTR